MNTLSLLYIRKDIMEWLQAGDKMKGDSVCHRLPNFRWVKWAMLFGRHSFARRVKVSETQ